RVPCAWLSLIPVRGTVTKDWPFASTTVIVLEPLENSADPLGPPVEGSIACKVTDSGPEVLPARSTVTCVTPPFSPIEELLRLTVTSCDEAEDEASTALNRSMRVLLLFDPVIVPSDSIAVTLKRPLLAAELI